MNYPKLCTIVLKSGTDPALYFVRFQPLIYRFSYSVMLPKSHYQPLLAPPHFNGFTILSRAELFRIQQLSRPRELCRFHPSAVQVCSHLLLAHMAHDIPASSNCSAPLIAQHSWVRTPGSLSNISHNNYFIRTESTSKYGKYNITIATSSRKIVYARISQCRFAQSRKQVS